jgi:hypothetical protein
MMIQFARISAARREAAIMLASLCVRENPGCLFVANNRDAKQDDKITLAIHIQRGTYCVDSFLFEGSQKI